MFLIRLAKAYFKRKTNAGFKQYLFKSSLTNTMAASGLLRLAPYLLIVPIIVFYGTCCNFLINFVLPL